MEEYTLYEISDYDLDICRFELGKQSSKDIQRRLDVFWGYLGARLREASSQLELDDNGVISITLYPGKSVYIEQKEYCPDADGDYVSSDGLHLWDAIDFDQMIRDALDCVADVEEMFTDRTQLFDLLQLARCSRSANDFVDRVEGSLGFEITSDEFTGYLEQVYVAAHTSIREIRDHIGLTQREFCAKYGIPLRTLENWEAHTAQSSRQCPLYLIVLLAHVAGMVNIFQNNIQTFE